jgi:hypothetical protein
MYAQRVTGNGTLSWAVNGVEVSTGGSFGNGTSAMVADGTGSYVAAWLSEEINYPIKAQKINGQGQLQWTAGGILVCNRPGVNPYSPVLAKSNGNSVIALWADERNYATNAIDIYAAKIDGNGSLVTAVVYTSIANGNWNNPGTWQGNMVPPAGADVVIKTAVIANVDATCNTLTVQAPGSLTVNTGVHVTVLH